MFSNLLLKSRVLTSSSNVRRFNINDCNGRREKRTGHNKLKNSLQVIKEPLER